MGTGGAGNYITDHCVASLAEAVRAPDGSLTNLDVGRNDLSITYEAAMQLAQAVLESERMEVFNGVPLRNGNLTTELDFVGKGTGLAVTTVLCGLVSTGSLGTVTITAEAALPVGAIIRGELTELDLSDKRLQQFDVVVLAAALGVPGCALVTLNLSGTQGIWNI